jgi:hypothetical protein
VNVRSDEELTPDQVSSLLTHLMCDQSLRKILLSTWFLAAPVALSTKHGDVKGAHVHARAAALLGTPDGSISLH